MRHGIAAISILPVRKEPDHRSEQINQVLFGETYAIIERHGGWLNIESTYDGYRGWIDQKQHHTLSTKDFDLIQDSDYGISAELVSSASSSLQSIPIVAGSNLPHFDGINFRIGREKFVYNGQAIQHDAKNPAVLERVLVRYLNAPYLWGGRSPFGIDCSGFTQVAFKFIGVSLPRDAYQQAETGLSVNFVEASKPGDLAFFSNEEGRITHVGVIIKDGRIIHASGKVRIDKLDHQGIYNSDEKRYSHQLKIIKRYF